MIKEKAVGMKQASLQRPQLKEVCPTKDFLCLELTNKIIALIYQKEACHIDPLPIKTELLRALEFLPSHLEPRSELEMTFLHQFLIARAIGMMLISKSCSNDRKVGIKYLDNAETFLKKLYLTKLDLGENDAH